MTDDEIRVFLSQGTRTGKIAWTAPSGQAHLAPVWFVVDDAATTLEVVFNTGADTAKGRALRRDPRLSLCAANPISPHGPQLMLTAGKPCARRQSAKASSQEFAAA